MELNKLLSTIDTELDQSINRLMELLRIPSISTNPQYSPDCLKAAEWLVKELNTIGFSASVRKTQGHPMVVAHSSSEKPQLLFYGHYDVQPVDPVEAWNHHPFEPTILPNDSKGVIQARGSSDDKGQLMTFIEACRYWKKQTGQLPQGISILIEGEEESASPSLIPFLKSNKDELKAELALICDTGLFASKVPAIITQLRGLVAMEFEITAPNKDLHSGLYGGLAVNPLNILGKIIANLHDQNGTITIPDFYEGVSELTPERKVEWDNLQFDSSDFLGEVGLLHPAGEKTKSPLEQLWSRPTLDVNGIKGGYSGDGFKTVIPSKASAKISCRLVGNQDPEKIIKNIKEFVISHLPKDCQIQFIDHGAAKACEMPLTHPMFATVKKSLSEEFSTNCVFAGCGASIPIAGFFQDILGMNSLLTGFSKENDNIHSPNEKYDIDSFHKGIRSWARVLYYVHQSN
ncbi:MAG: dipeptidase [Rhodobacteraceae bacterium]|nr:dipeptidase [Paracoccaceae bacterium]